MTIADSIQIRCSELHLIMPEPTSKAEREQGSLSVGAKSHIEKIFKRNLIESLGFESAIGFSGNKYTEKGLLIENQAISGSSFIRAQRFAKNSDRLNNGYITGECDIYDQANRRIIDTKCTYSIDTHPFFLADAINKANNAGYQWQMQGYMWLYDCNIAEIDFWLLPLPEELLKPHESRELLIDAISLIPLIKRVTTVQIKRDDVAIKRIARKVEAANEHYQSLLQEFNDKQPFLSSSKSNTEKAENSATTPNPNSNRKQVLL